MLTPISPNPASDAKLSYSQGMLAEGRLRILEISGQIGLDASGRVPGDFEAQARLAWENLLAVLAEAGMTPANLIKVTAFLTDPADYAAYAALRGDYLGDARPASTLLVVAALARPEWLVEIEATAVAEA